ncbi:MAG TPA: Holliday junction branch migration DNA helicase RuvB [Candidatus Paceibacterota bacterium]|nr:Holliday junction branch migration DNA helicase RuvB [Candidatus Paceibacterota bacterium]
MKKSPANSTGDDANIDITLRPTAWDDYVGQEKIKGNIKVILDAAKKRGEAADHLLFSGPAGLGKTTLAYLVAHELGVPVRTTSGPALEKTGDIAAILTNLNPGEILFIDEAHRVNPMIEEVLYPAMEARKLHLVVGKGPSARTLSLDLPPFTLIAATTRENLLSTPLRSRFGATLRLNYYDIEDIKKIVSRSAKILGVHATPEAVQILAGAARGTPRVANRLLRRARDFAEVHGAARVSSESGGASIVAIDRDAALKTLEMLEIDEAGLEPQDRRLLMTIIEKFHGGPVGINTLAAALSEDKGVIEDIYEPFLMTLGFLQRSSAGRIVLPAAYKHLKIRDEGELL